MVTPEENAAHDAAAEKNIISDVAKYGFHVAQVPGDGYSPNFSYTIGLYKTYGYPELICFGLNLDLLHSVLWSGKELGGGLIEGDIIIINHNFNSRLMHF